MEKWVRRSVKAAVTAGVVGVGAVGVAQADTTVVAPGTVSESVSVAGDNGILVGNSVSVPVVVPVTDNSVAATLIGAAVNAEDVFLGAGILGAAHGCSSSGSDDYTDVSPFTRSSSTSVVGDNQIGSGNSISVPIVAPVTGNDVAVAGIGAAGNVDSLVAALGILGYASAGDCGDGGGGYGGGGYERGNGHERGNGGGNGGGPYDEYGYSEHGAGGDTTIVAGEVVSKPSSQIGDNSILSGNSISVPVYVPITDNDVAVAGIGGAVNADDVSGALGILGYASAGDGGGADLLGGVTSLAGLPTSEAESASAELHSAEPELQDASLSAAGGDTTVVSPTVKSASTSVVGDNSIGSGNSLSVPIVAPITGNDVAVAGIGGAVNGDDVTVAAGVLGDAEAEGPGGDTTVVAPTVKSESTSSVGDNSILSGNSLSAPIVAPITGNDVAVAGIGGAVNAEDVTVVAGILGTASALLGN